MDDTKIKESLANIISAYMRNPCGERLENVLLPYFRNNERLSKIEVLEEVLIDIRKEFPQYDRFLAGRGHENNIICGALECKINELKAGN